MANKKLKEKKAKAKERATYEKKVKDRLFAARKQRSEYLYKSQIEADVKDSLGKLSPIRRDTDVAGMKAQLEKNLQILKALEEEYIKGQQSRENLHEELAAEGYNSLEEKMEALRIKAQEIAINAQASAMTDEEKAADALSFVLSKNKSEKSEN